MFINRLINRGPTPLIEQMLKFTEKRARLLGEDITNLSTPNYQTRDLSLERFQKLLSAQVDQRDHRRYGVQYRGEERRGDVVPSTVAPGANDGGEIADVAARVENPSDNILFHDRNNRSVEQLQSDNAQNALLHNMLIELLRKQFSQIQEALREKVA